MLGTDALIAEIRTEFPRFQILEKASSQLMRAIDRALRALTFGQQCHFMSEYHTVIGSTLYTAPTWHPMADEDKVVLLRHERVHLRQARKLGLPLMAFLYLIPIFPVGLAYARARLEWQAYQETLRATFELKGESSLRSARLREQIVRRFTGPDYGWMWPFRRAVERWYDQHVELLCRPALDAPAALLKSRNHDGGRSAKELG